MIYADSFVEELVSSFAEQRPDLILIPYGLAAPEDRWPAHKKDLEKVVRHVATKVGVRLSERISSARSPTNLGVARFMAD